MMVIMVVITRDDHYGWSSLMMVIMVAITHDGHYGGHCGWSSLMMVIMVVITHMTAKTHCLRYIVIQLF